MEGKKKIVHDVIGVLNNEINNFDVCFRPVFLILISKQYAYFEDTVTVTNAYCP